MFIKSRKNLQMKITLKNDELFSRSLLELWNLIKEKLLILILLIMNGKTSCFLLRVLNVTNQPNSPWSFSSTWWWVGKLSLLWVQLMHLTTLVKVTLISPGKGLAQILPSLQASWIAPLWSTPPRFFPLKLIFPSNDSLASLWSHLYTLIGVVSCFPNYHNRF